MHSDHQPFARFTGAAQLNKSINSLIGIIEGIAIDRRINSKEIGFLRLWLQEHEELRNRHPFNELIPVVEAALADGFLTEEERDDIAWLCERLTSTEFYDQITADMQRLHALVGGIMVDGHVSEEELRGLSAWLGDHEHLKSCWPYDEIESLVVGILADQTIDEREQRLLKEFFSEFVAVLDDRTITTPLIADPKSQTLMGLCAVCPDVSFQGSTFCFTGASSRYRRTDLAEIVINHGGEFANTVTRKVDYLVIGAEGNPCWAYACYGRKVEQAVALRRQGMKILLIHENDFHDAVLDS